MKKPEIIIICDIFVVVLLSITQIIVSNHLSTKGVVMESLESQLASLEKENMLLKEKMYTASSYTTIASYAASLGFSEKGGGEIVYTAPIPLAQK